jgi:periplasmic protein CpxP/Spy
MTKGIKILFASAVALSLAGGVAMAQQPPGAPMAGGPARMEYRGPHCDDMAAHLAGRLAFAEVKLGLTESQKASWRKLADLLKSAEEPAQKLCAEAEKAPFPKTLPERLDRMVKMSEMHATALRQVVPALEQFYGTLSTEQKTIADELLMPFAGFGPHGHGHPGPHGQGGPGFDAPPPPPAGETGHAPE